jgi:hypothetical protein
MNIEINMNQYTVAELFNKLSTYWAAREFNGTSLELAVFTAFACNYYMVENKTFTDNTEIDYKKINDLITKIENKEISEERIYEISTYMVYSDIVRAALFVLNEDLIKNSEKNMMPLIRNCINTALNGEYGFFYSKVSKLEPDFSFYPQNNESTNANENQPLRIDLEFLNHHCNNIAKILGISLNSIELDFYFKGEFSRDCSGSFGYNSASQGWNLSLYLPKDVTKREVLNILAHELKHGEQRFSGREYRRVSSLENLEAYDSSEAEIEAREFEAEYLQEAEGFENLDEPFFFVKE